MRNACLVVVLTGAAAASSALADARVRAVHASPDAPVVDVLVDGAPAITGLAFTQASGYAALPGGTYNVKVVPTGLTSPAVIDADLTLTDGRDYSVAAVNLLSSIEALVLQDDNTLMADMARVRFVHASPNAPAVDIALAGGAVLFGNVSFKGVGDYLSVPGGTYDLEVRLAGTDTVVLPIGPVTFSNNTVYTAWAMGLVDNLGTPLRAVVTVDAVPAPGSLAMLGLGGLLAARRRR